MLRREARCAAIERYAPRKYLFITPVRSRPGVISRVRIGSGVDGLGLRRSRWHNGFVTSSWRGCKLAESPFGGIVRFGCSEHCPVAFKENPVLEIVHLHVVGDIGEL